MFFFHLGILQNDEIHHLCIINNLVLPGTVITRCRIRNYRCRLIHQVAPKLKHRRWIHYIVQAVRVKIGRVCALLEEITIFLPR